MTALTTDALTGLIDRKHKCLEQLSTLGERQLDEVRSGSIGALLEVLAVKQRVMLELERLEAHMEPFRAQSPGDRAWRTPQQRQCCIDRLADSERLLEKIIAQEQESEQELVRRRDALGERLQGVQLASRARGAYTSQPAPRRSQLDLLSGR